MSALQSAPNTVRTSFWLWIASVVISAISVIVAVVVGVPAVAGTSSSATSQAIAGGAVAVTAIVGLVIGGGLRVLFAFFMLQGRNWARIVLLIVAILTLLAGFASILTGDFITLIALLVVIAATVMMFLPESNAYFRKRP